MERKGLCATCVHAESCIFVKKLPILQCEEFYSGESVPVRVKQAKTKRVVAREAAAESE